MADVRLGIILHGATGRIGTAQHLGNALDTLRRTTYRAGDGRSVELDPILVGRDAGRLAEVAAAHGIARWTTDLGRALQDPNDSIFFDCAATPLRSGLVRQAIAAGKHVFCEKPLAERGEDALALARLAREHGVRHGVVMSNVWLPGMQKLERLVRSGFFGQVLAVRGEFGYWIFEGDWQPAQRPSWNYRAEDGGGIILDMMSHWHYMLAQLFGPVTQVQCLKSTLIPERWDEHGRRYAASAEDTAFVAGLIDDRIPVQINLSWATRVRRDDLLTLQVDGSHGSAVAGVRDCFIQPRAATPKPVWNPDAESSADRFAEWQRMPANQVYENPFRAQWRAFIEHVLTGQPFPWNFDMAAEGVQLAAACHRSAAEGRRLKVA
ncbi:MAG: Gfo/Idh/MocA family protein [Burkholderiaceae bacterium]